MNDYLLESQKKEREPKAERIQISDIGSENLLPQLEPRTPTKNSTAYKILTIERQAKINVTFNNICIILFLTLFPFGVIISTFANVNWFLMVEGTDYYYWVNLFFIRKSCIETIQSHKFALPALCKGTTNPTIYFFFMPLFYINGCQSGNLTKDDPSNLCSVMVSYYYSGLLAGLAVILGLLLHTFHIWQLMRITFSRDPNLIKGFHPLRVAYFVIFFYLAPPIYWFFGSATIINTNSQRPLLERFGTSVYCYVGAFLFYLLLVLWFRKVYKKGIRRNLVNTLLNAEKKYVSDFESISHYENDLP